MMVMMLLVLFSFQLRESEKERKKREARKSEDTAHTYTYTTTTRTRTTSNNRIIIIIVNINKQMLIVLSLQTTNEQHVWSSRLSRSVCVNYKCIYIELLVYKIRIYFFVRASRRRGKREREQIYSMQIIIQNNEQRVASMKMR